MKLVILDRDGVINRKLQSRLTVTSAGELEFYTQQSQMITSSRKMSGRQSRAALTPLPD